jgi:hypothetical protein
MDHHGPPCTLLTLAVSWEAEPGRPKARKLALNPTWLLPIGHLTPNSPCQLNILCGRQRPSAPTDTLCHTYILIGCGRQSPAPEGPQTRTKPHWHPVPSHLHLCCGRQSPAPEGPQTRTKPHWQPVPTHADTSSIVPYLG